MEKNKEYLAGTYIKKNPRKKKRGRICPVCASCTDRKFCKNRKDIKLMRKCPECKECSDAENCDIFYINEEHKVLIPIGRDDDGNIIRKSFSGKTEAEAIYKSVQYQKDVEAGIIEPTLKKTMHSVASIIQEYEDNKLKNGIISECTYHTNMYTLTRIKKEAWANKKIADVKRKELEDFFLKERANGMSNSILRKDFAMIRTAFDIALDRDYITAKQHYFLGKYGIMRPISLKKDKKVGALKLQEQVKLMEYMNTHNVKHHDLFMLCLNTGTRIGELLALEVQDVNLKEGYFNIRRTTTLNKEGKVILGETTKTSTGERMIVLNEITKPILQHAIENRNPSEDDLIFCKEDGSIYGDGGINSAFKRLCKNAGIKGSVNTHMLRHTFITRSKEAGVDVDATKTIAGHSNIHLTQDIYNENQKDYLEKQAKVYANYILEIQNQK